MNYATIKYYDIANGPGVRTSVFVSGCRHHCPGCFNAVAWDFCNLRCAPERIPELRERYEGIGPGWHMNKKHWISVRFDSDVPGELLKELVRQSYELATAHLTKKQRAELAEKDKQL